MKMFDHGEILINGEKISCVDIKMDFDKDISTANHERLEPIKEMKCSMTMKISRWNRFKLWLMLQKMRFAKTQTYEVELKTGYKDGS